MSLIIRIGQTDMILTNHELRRLKGETEFNYFNAEKIPYDYIVRCGKKYRYQFNMHNVDYVGGLYTYPKAAYNACLKLRSKLLLEAKRNKKKKANL